MKDWDGHCQRCGKKTNVHIMSMFNTQLICLKCEEKEREHPRYKAACDAEIAACQKGDFNFPGIGRKR